MESATGRLFLVSVASNPPPCARRASWGTLTSTWRRRNRGIVSLCGYILNCFLKNRTMWYSPEVEPLGVADRGSRPMIDDDRPSRQSMRCRAALRARGEPPRRLGARPCKRSSFPALTTRGSLGSGRSRLQCRRRLWINDGRGHGSSKTRDAAISRESASRRKFSLLQSFEKSENAEILGRHRGTPCLSEFDWNPRGRLPRRLASVVQSRVCHGRCPVDRGARGLDGGTEWPTK